MCEPMQSNTILPFGGSSLCKSYMQSGVWITERTKNSKFPQLMIHISGSAFVPVFLRFN